MRGLKMKLRTACCALLALCLAEGGIGLPPRSGAIAEVSQGQTVDMIGGEHFRTFDGTTLTQATDNRTGVLLSGESAGSGWISKQKLGTCGVELAVKLRDFDADSLGFVVKASDQRVTEGNFLMVRISGRTLSLTDSADFAPLVPGSGDVTEFDLGASVETVFSVSRTLKIAADDREGGCELRVFFDGAPTVCLRAFLTGKTYFGSGFAGALIGGGSVNLERFDVFPRAEITLSPTYGTESEACDDAFAGFRAKNLNPGWDTASAGGYTLVGNSNSENDGGLVSREKWGGAAGIRVSAKLGGNSKGTIGIFIGEQKPITSPWSGDGRCYLNLDSDAMYLNVQGLFDWDVRDSESFSYGEGQTCVDFFETEREIVLESIALSVGKTCVRVSVDGRREISYVRDSGSQTGYVGIWVGQSASVTVKSFEVTPISDVEEQIDGSLESVDLLLSENGVASEATVEQVHASPIPDAVKVVNTNRPNVTLGGGLMSDSTYGTAGVVVDATLQNLDRGYFGIFVKNVFTGTEFTPWSRGGGIALQFDNDEMFVSGNADENWDEAAAIWSYPGGKNKQEFFKQSRALRLSARDLYRTDGKFDCVEVKVFVDDMEQSVMECYFYSAVYAGKGSVSVWANSVSAEFLKFEVTPFESDGPTFDVPPVPDEYNLIRQSKDNFRRFEDYRNHYAEHEDGSIDVGARYDGPFGMVFSRQKLLDQQITMVFNSEMLDPIAADNNDPAAGGQSYTFMGIALLGNTKENIAFASGDWVIPWGGKLKPMMFRFTADKGAELVAFDAAGESLGDLVSTGISTEDYNDGRDHELKIGLVHNLAEGTSEYDSITLKITFDGRLKVDFTIRKDSTDPKLAYLREAVGRETVTGFTGLSTHDASKPLPDRFSIKGFSVNQIANRADAEAPTADNLPDRTVKPGTDFVLPSLLNFRDNMDTEPSCTVSVRGPGGFSVIGKQQGDTVRLETPGDYTVEYEIADRAGNRAVKTFVVTVSGEPENEKGCGSLGAGGAGMTGVLAAVLGLGFVGLCRRRNRLVEKR